MGWSIGYDDKWKRDIGYGVPAVCDHPDCNNEIDRGLSYVCGDAPYGGDQGCGLFFCAEHLFYKAFVEDDEENPQLCMRCSSGLLPHVPKPDILKWVEWKLTDDSWKEWRDENPDLVEEMQRRVPNASQIMDFE